MQGDFSRITFDPTKHFSAVLSQQGRLTLDADVNEGFAAVLHYLRTVVADLVGPCAYPVGGAGGFAVTLPTPPDDGRGLLISRGRMYVDGILVENDTDEVSYFNQPDGYLDPDSAADALPAEPYLVYLRVWERLITAVQDPDVREIALGDFGPDTAARSKVIWQVAAASAELGTSPPPDTEDALLWIEQNLRRPLEALPQLQARAVRPANSDESLCDLGPDSSYRGTENQLYRVEVHTGGGAPSGPAGQLPGNQPTSKAGAVAATFKFSRENASVVLAISSLNGDEVVLADRGRDDKLSLEVGDWVEIVDDAYELRIADDLQQAPAPALRKVIALDPTARLVTLSADSTGSSLTGTDQSLHPLLRRWDHPSSTSTEQSSDLGVAADGALPIVEDSWIELEDGIGIRFGSVPDGKARQYRRGDYWWIPARTIPGDVLWPQDARGPAARPPAGVAYHYAPLAWVSADTVQELRDPIDTPHGELTLLPAAAATAPAAPAKAAGGKATPKRAANQ